VTPARTGTNWLPDIRPLKLPAAVLGIGLVVVLTVINQITLSGSGGLQTALGLVGLAVATLGMPLVAWFSSYRWGTRRFVDDLGFRITWIDVVLGAGGAIALTIVMVIVNLVFVAVRLPHGSNLDDVSAGGRNALVFGVMFVMAGIVAPVTEELLFRGVIFRGLASRMNVWVAMVLQGVVFGCAHFLFDQGWGNVNLLVSLAVLGCGLGFLARLTGRLAPGMIAHSLFNCLQLALLWITLK
jgi:membrane protease YdiL (CAAX protease family)